VVGLEQRRLRAVGHPLRVAGPSPTALSWPGSASKSSTVEPTSFSLELPSSELEAPQLLEDEDEEPELEEAPHVEPLESSVLLEAPHVELELSVLVSLVFSVLEAPQLEVDSSSASAFVSVLIVVVYGGLEVVDVTPAARG